MGPPVYHKGVLNYEVLLSMSVWFTFEDSGGKIREVKSCVITRIYRVIARHFFSLSAGVRLIRSGFLTAASTMDCRP